MGKVSRLVGKLAPALELPTIPDGKMYKLPIGQKPIAIFFVREDIENPLRQFPAANTAGCTMEACAFRDAKKDNIVFKRHADLEIIGISAGMSKQNVLMADPTAKQASFADQYNLPYPILSDAEGTARKAYEVDRAFFGATDGRETFFIDGKGIVRAVCQKNIDVFGHTRFVEQQLLQLERAP